MLNMRKISLNEGQSLNVEPSAMLACKNVEMETRLNGSVFAVAKRYFLGGESLFQNCYTAKEGGGWIALEESLPGQINAYELQPGKNLVIGRKAYVAADQNVKVSFHYAGAKGLFRGVGAVKLKASVIDKQSGRVFFNSMEGITKAIVISEETGPVIIDNEDIVAYTDTLQVSRRKLGDMKTLFLSGEGFVNEFKGNGTVFVGSGQKVITSNLVDRIIKAAAQFVLPEPKELANRLTAIGLIYLIGRYSNLDLLVRATRELVYELQHRPVY